MKGLALCRQAERLVSHQSFLVGEAASGISTLLTIYCRSRSLALSASCNFLLPWDRLLYVIYDGSFALVLSPVPQASLFLVAWIPSPRGGGACLPFWKFWVPSA